MAGLESFLYRFTEFSLRWSLINNNVRIRVLNVGLGEDAEYRG